MKTMRILILILLIFSTLLAQGEKVNIAVLRLDPIHITEDEAQILTKKLSSELVKRGKYTVLDRGEMEAILQEQGFQQTGCTSSECAVEVGQLLGVQKIIAGSVGKLGSIYYTEIRMIDVETSRIDQTVDHNQEGSIENVLLTSLPYVASQLSGGATVSSMMAESVKAEDQTLFLDAESQTDTAHAEVKDDRPKTRGGKEVELIAHHKNGHIFMDGQIVGKDEVEIQVEDRDVELYEKKWFYKSKPQKVNLARIGDDEFGVGGKPKELVLGVSYFAARNAMRINPSFEFTIGALKQSARSSGVNFIIGSLEGIGAFTDEVNDDYLFDTVSATIGGFFEWRQEWEIAQIFKWGLGFDVGYVYISNQSLNDYYEDYTFSTVNPDIIILRHDVKFHNFGGPQIKLAVGWKKIFVESKLRFAMGIESQKYYEPNEFSAWDLVTNVVGAEESLIFTTMPMISIGLLVTL